MEGQSGCTRPDRRLPPNQTGSRQNSFSGSGQRREYRQELDLDLDFIEGVHLAAQKVFSEFLCHPSNTGAVARAQGDLKLVFQFHRINADVPLELCNLWNGNERAAPQRNISFQAGQQLLIALPQAAQAGNFCDAIPQRRSLCGDILPDPVGIPLLEGFTEIMM